MNREELTPFMFCFLETDMREQKKYGKIMQTSVDNTVNDLHYEIKFENIWNVRNIAFLFFFLKIFYSWRNIFDDFQEFNSWQSLEMIMWLIVRCFSVNLFFYKNNQAGKKTSRLRNRSNKWNLTQMINRWNRMHKLRRNFTIK